jgi:hypothetical protein
MKLSIIFGGRNAAKTRPVENPVPAGKVGAALGDAEIGGPFLDPDRFLRLPDLQSVWSGEMADALSRDNTRRPTISSKVFVWG